MEHLPDTGFCQMNRALKPLKNNKYQIFNLVNALIDPPMFQISHSTFKLYSCIDNI